MLKALTEKFMQRVARNYRAEVGRELSRYGLLYEDAIVETEEVKLALKRLPEPLLVAREQRLKRAMMLSAAHKELPIEIASAYDPYESYLAPFLEEVKQEKKEYYLK